jgi:hypothetical protein
VHSFGVRSVGEMGVFELSEAEPVEQQFWVDTVYSGVSAGTELTFLNGSNPYLHARWDPEWDVPER